MAEETKDCKKNGLDKCLTVRQAIVITAINVIVISTVVVLVMACSNN